MAKYKPYSYAQGQFIPVFFDKQIQQGTFEYTLSYLIDRELDLSIFDGRFKNDETGAPAYDPRILLKIILFAYSRGITKSRRIARCCEENVMFMALSANSRPHFTTIADFISSMNKEVSHLFLEVLMVCDHQKLIGKEMFAIDGCKHCRAMLRRNGAVPRLISARKWPRWKRPSSGWWQSIAPRTALRKKPRMRREKINI